MFPLFICLFLVFQCQNIVSEDSKGEVIKWTKDGIGYQMTFPSHKNKEVVTKKEWKLSSKFKYKVVCTIYKEENPVANIFTSEGVILDTLILDNIGPTTCNEENIVKYITPKDPTNGAINMIYLFSNKKCVSRKLIVKERPFMALVERSDYATITCPNSVLMFLNDFRPTENIKTPGGIVNLAFNGKAHLMDYIEHLLTPGTPSSVTFNDKDPEGKQFKFVCRDDATTRSSNIITGSIIFVDSYGEDLVIDKFQLTSCSINNININRQLTDRNNRFRAVFKTHKGKCYEREYEIYNVNFMAYFVETTMVRHKENSVECPDKFTGDVGLNKKIPWWWLFTYATAFSLDLRTKEVKE